MVSDDMLLSYPDWTILLIFHTNASDKQLGDVISQNNKPLNSSQEYWASQNATKLRPRRNLLR